MTWAQLFNHFMDLSYAGVEILPFWLGAIVPLTILVRAQIIKEQKLEYYSQVTQGDNQ